MIVEDTSNARAIYLKKEKRFFEFMRLAYLTCFNKKNEEFFETKSLGRFMVCIGNNTSIKSRRIFISKQFLDLVDMYVPDGDVDTFKTQFEAFLKGNRILIEFITKTETL